MRLVFTSEDIRKDDYMKKKKINVCIFYIMSWWPKNKKILTLHGC